jgi:invasion protein IalB
MWQTFRIVAAFLMISGIWSSSRSLAEVSSRYGDWTLRCGQEEGGAPCVLGQSITAEDRPDMALMVLILRARGVADGKGDQNKNERLLRVRAPLDVLLPAGLGLKIDERDVGRVGFVRCQSDGCLAEAILDDALIDQLKKGKSATFIVFQDSREGIGIPVPLMGFQEGFDVLMSRR